MLFGRLSNIYFVIKSIPNYLKEKLSCYSRSVISGNGIINGLDDFGVDCPFNYADIELIESLINSCDNFYFLILLS